MAWIESHQAIERHPKTADLMRRMNWDLDTTLAKLHRLWWWCVDYAEDGDLRKHNDARIGAAVGLNGEDSKRFVEAMVASGWIDRKPYFRVHDWWDYIGLFLQSKYKRSPRKWRRVRNLYATVTQPLQHPLRNRKPTNLTKPTDRDHPPSSPSEKIPPIEAFDRAIQDDSFKAQLAKAYHPVSLEAEAEKMRAWIQANPKKAKKNWRRFIQNWLNKARKDAEARHGREAQRHVESNREADLRRITKTVVLPEMPEGAAAPSAP